MALLRSRLVSTAARKVAKIKPTVPSLRLQRLLVLRASPQFYNVHGPNCRFQLANDLVMVRAPPCTDPRIQARHCVMHDKTCDTLQQCLRKARQSGLCRLHSFLILSARARNLELYATVASRFLEEMERSAWQSQSHISTSPSSMPIEDWIQF